MEPLDRRHFMRTAAAAGLSWLTPLGASLARAAEVRREPARSVIVLWMSGGPSQLETFDPHPGTLIGGDARAIDTSARGVRIAAGLPRLAEQMHSVALVRSLVSQEGDHERGTYFLKTGRRPDPTVAHPSLGAVVCHALPGPALDIPRHVSILPNQWPAQGGALGAELDAFKVGDPANRVPDLTAKVPADRFDRRLQDLAAIERRAGAATAAHRDLLDRARRMMSSEQVKAFDVNAEPLAVRASYGDTPFGRGCLAARRLIEAGVRCVEVTLDGWDSHANNDDVCRRLNAALDPAFAGLLSDLRKRQLLERTLVLCVGEFGRTPTINPLGGRDHWPHNFTAALAGAGIRGGVTVGASDPDGGKQPADPVPVANLHATVYTALGIDPEKTLRSPIGRTFPRSDGEPIEGVLAR